METAAIAQELSQLIEQRNWTAVRQMASDLAAPELADVLLELDKPLRVLLFRALPRDTAADTVAYMEPGTRDSLLKELTDEETRQLLIGHEPPDKIIRHGGESVIASEPLVETLRLLMRR